MKILAKFCIETKTLMIMRQLMSPNDLKHQEWAMSGSGKCKDNLNFCANYGAAEKKQEKR